MSPNKLGETKVSEFLEERKAFSSGDRVSKAVGQMLENGEYEVFVTLPQGRVLYFTTRDALAVSDTQGTKLETVASPSPRLAEGDSVARAATLMFEHRLRALPVTVKGETVMALSAPGLAKRLIPELQSSIKVKDLATVNPVTVESSESAEAAKEMMLRRSFDHLPVLKGGKLVGMLTSSDLLERLLPAEGIPKQFRGVEQRRFDFAVSRVAQDSVVEVDPGMAARDAVEQMVREGSSYALAVNDRHVEGIMTLRDVLRPLVPPAKEGPPFYIIGLPDKPFEADAARQKLSALSASLVRAFPFIEEIRAVIKTKGISRTTNRYEVTVTVYSPREVHAYSAQGYDLAEVFDEIAPKLKRLLASRQSRVTATQGEAGRKRGP